jgi:hypothetical protein
MEVIEVNETTKKEIEKSINKYGFTVEHYYPFFEHCETQYKNNLFFKFNNGMGIMAQKTKQNVYYSISEVLAPKTRRKELYFKFLDYVFKHGSNKVMAEFRTEFRDELMSDDKYKKNFRDTGICFSLTWPVFDMKKWHGDKLDGKKWKKIRNMVNRVYSDFKVSFGKPSDFSHEQLIKLLNQWLKHRNAEEIVDTQQYINIIKGGFKGYDHVRIIALDGEPCAITAGWETIKPNTYYSNLGILNYKCDGLGEFANWDDLVCLKHKGYRYVDFGGSDEDLLQFKNKFRPTSEYQTHFYYIHKH